jgi:hypothetical protein
VKYVAMEGLVLAVEAEEAVLLALVLEQVSEFGAGSVDREHNGEDNA